MLRKLFMSRTSRNIIAACVATVFTVATWSTGAWAQPNTPAASPSSGSPSSGSPSSGSPSSASPSSGSPSSGSTAGTKDLPALTVDISGFGFGHGQGMGQWGAYGYASVYHWDYQKILAHYYGGTTLGTLPAPEPPVTVHLVELDGRNTLASAVAGAHLVATWGSNATLTAVSVEVARSGGEEAIFSGPGCGGPWEKVATTAGPVTIASGGPTPPGASGSFNRSGSSRPDSIASSELEVCLPGVAPRVYRGDLVAQPDGQTQNVLPLEDYIDGVVPAESPASWMGTGEAALQALAVAARSVAVALVSTEGEICDTTQCQVYEGVPDEYGVTADRAVSSTAGQVLYCDSGSTCGPKGSIAVAEYSSSTGGYTAGGAFPPVADLGDSVEANPVHAWSMGVPLSQVEATFPTVGPLQHVTVTKRNGLGQIGGRVEQIEVVGDQGSVSLTGNQFAADFDLYSNWFAVHAVSPVVVPTSQTGGTTSTPTSSGSGSGSTTSVTSGTSTSGTSTSGTSTSGTSTSGTSTGGSTSPVTKPGVHSQPPGGTRGLEAGNGYWVVNTEGDVAAFGAAPFFGTAAGTSLEGIVTAMAATPDDKGYWLAGSNGGVLAFGDANWYGSASKLHLARRVVGIAPALGGRGYWLVATDGGIFAYGDAHYYGSVSKYHLEQPIVGIAATPDGHGYWLVSRDGGIFAFGDAGFYGSTGDLKLNKPIVAIIASRDGRGYTLIGKDGGVFAFGDAGFLGSLPADHIAANVVAVSPTDKGRGYYVLTARGKIYAFGNGAPSGDPARATNSVPGAAIAIVGNRRPG